MPIPSRRQLLALALAGLAVAALAVAAWFVWRHAAAPLPTPSSPAYEEYAELFEVGTALLDSGLIPQALEKLTQAVDRIPQEPAAWANRGLAYLRQAQPDLTQARADLQRAHSLAPGNPDIEELLGLLAERSGKLAEAIAHLRQASAADPNNPRRLYKLIELVEREAGPGADEQRQRLLEQLLERRPANLHLLAMHALVAGRRGDLAALRDTCRRLEKLAPSWDEETRQAFAEVNKEANAEKIDPTELTILVRRLDNHFKAQPGYAREMNELSPPAARAGDSLQQFVRLAPLRTQPSPPDRGLKLVEKKYEWRPEVLAPGARWDVILPCWLNGKDTAAVLVGNAREVRRADAAGPAFAFPSGTKAVAPTASGILAIDWNNDHASDVLLAGAGGLRLHQQKADGTFEEITDRTKLNRAVLAGDYHGAWAADVDLDGDLDIVLAPRKGAPLLLRNNGDGTFLAMPIFPGVEAARAFAWADLDNDGAADAALVDANGKLHVFMNERSGQFRRRPAPEGLDACLALAVTAAHDDGVFALVALQADGTLKRISDVEKGKSWAVADLGRVATKLPAAPGEALLIAVDLDNSGTLDLVVRAPAGVAVLLADEKGEFQVLDLSAPPETKGPIRALADVVSLEGNARFHFLDLAPDGQPRCFATTGTKGYHWHLARPRAEPTAPPDQRINSFALGGEAELRSGTLVVKRPIDRPVVHFGLGERSRVSLLRFVWTNGALQFEFDKPADAVVRVEQRLTGSCPFLFTWDGRQVAFVTDFCWSTPLGLYINAQKPSGGYTETTEWVKVRGDQLAPRDGHYDVRVQANLWETHYLDLLSLMVVDHPPGTAVFCDERFFLTPTKPRLYVTGEPRPVARALDRDGKDVTDLVRATDGRYLAPPPRPRYQGVTGDHWVEVELGEDAPRQGPVYLLAHGWLYPTDSSINAALEQSRHDRPQPLTLEVPDGNGGWKVAQAALGFPAGKNKTVVLRLDGADGKGGNPRRFRLRTNLEVYWDSLHFAPGAESAQLLQHTLTARSAELRFRGILKMTRADAQSPEIPHYDQVISTGQYWRDLIGFHTRFGDVKELVEKVDDRYVMMNAGDELLLRFDVPPGPPPGWRRDFVWVSDGWTKDGNLNTKFSKTVLPLPYHGMSGYDTPPGRLQDDPVYRRHARDWQTYHTRLVTPAAFEQGLRGFRRDAAKR